MEAGEVQVLRPLRHFPAIFLRHRCERREKSGRRVGVVAYASAMGMGMVFGGEGGASRLVMVFDGVEEEGGVDVGVLRVAGRALESRTVCVALGHYETRADALLRRRLVRSPLDDPSWNDEPRVSALCGDASLTM